MFMLSTVEDQTRVLPYIILADPRGTIFHILCAVTTPLYKAKMMT
jgi:hypothetical protein